MHEQKDLERLCVEAYLDAARSLNERAALRYQQALAKQERTLGREHLNTASILNNLAMLYKKNIPPL